MDQLKLLRVLWMEVKVMCLSSIFGDIPEIYYYEYSKALFNSTFEMYFSSVVASGCARSMEAS